MKLTAESTMGDVIARFRQLTGSTADETSLKKRGKPKLLAAIEAAEGLLAQSQQLTQEALDALAAVNVAKTIAAGTIAGAQDALAAPEKQPLPVINDGLGPIPAKKPKAKKEKKAKEKKEKGPVIRAVAEAMLLKVVSVDDEKRPYGMPYEDILVELRKQFEGCKTTVACLRWYAVHMRERGEKVPARPRATPAKAA